MPIPLSSLDSILQLPKWLAAAVDPLLALAGRRGYRTQASNSLDLSRIHKALVVQTYGLGDVILTTPLLRELHRNAPSAKVTAVIWGGHFPVLEHCPYVHEVFEYQIDRRGARSTQIWRHAKAVAKLASHLWRQNFDLAIVPRWDDDHRYAGLIAYLSGARVRAGFSHDRRCPPTLLTGGGDRLFTHLLDHPRSGHEVELNLALLKSLGADIQQTYSECWTTPADDEDASTELAAANHQKGQPLIALCPGAGFARKIWPIDRFAEVAAELHFSLDARFLVVGGPGDRERGATLRTKLGEAVIDCTGRKTLRQTTALLKHCAYCIGNDTGPVHLANACGVHALQISCHPQDGDIAHPGAPQRFGPWDPKSIVMQPATASPPCTDHCSASEPHCILQISAEAVVDRVKAALVSGNSVISAVGPSL